MNRMYGFLGGLIVTAFGLAVFGAIWKRQLEADMDLQLKQLARAGWAGVPWSKLIDRRAARELVKLGLARPCGQFLLITGYGLSKVKTIPPLTIDHKGCAHEFVVWRNFPDGSGGEMICKKCGLGAMEWSLRMGL